ncbi:MAG TPA: glycoside hydrolase family 20 zincin-like fold domain-containing protein, partial [Gemmatimonadales bacterium]|nr:glycoside hydrolase family 20 zincin-like fold domain-containing protein [Gemmatimonadales bacterium]
METTLRIVLLGLAAVGCAVGKATPPVSPSPRSYSIVPAPQRIQPKAGAFRLSPATRIMLSDPADADLRALADLLLVPLRAASGLPLPVSSRPGDDRATDVISLRLTSGSVSSHPESYQLVVTPERAALSAGTTAGLFWGLQTIRQLLPPELEAGRPGPQPGWAIPALEIDDEPRFPYRAILLDVARWFYPPEFIKKLIDLLALYKMNTLQLHLTDDQGWRLE